LRAEIGKELLEDFEKATLKYEQIINRAINKEPNLPDNNTIKITLSTVKMNALSQELEALKKKYPHLFTN
jgi:hypothetical protein